MGIKALPQFVSRGAGCPIPGNVGGQAEWSSQKPDPVQDIPACGDRT